MNECYYRQCEGGEREEREMALRGDRQGERRSFCLGFS